MTEQTAEGTLGRVIGKAKETVGAVLGRDDLVQEGALQQGAANAAVEAQRQADLAAEREKQSDIERRRIEAETERQRLEAQAEADRREAAITQQRIAEQQQARADEDQEQLQVDSAQARAKAQIDAQENAAADKLVRDAREVARLESEARRAEATAAAIDPEEGS